MYGNRSRTNRSLLVLISGLVVALTGCPPEEPRPLVCTGAPIPSLELFPGCSAADLQLYPKVVARPALASMDRVLSMFGEIPDVMDVAQAFDTGRQEYEAALAQIRRGDPCEATPTFDMALSSFDNAQAEMDLLVMTFESVPPDPSGSGDDVDADASRALVFSIMADELADSVGEAVSAAGLLQSLCDEVEDTFEITSTVETLDDNRRMIVFPTGETVRLGWDIEIGGSITEGAEATVSGKKYKDGSYHGGGMTENPNAPLYETPEFYCIELRFTPRRATKSLVGPWIKHEKNGYRDQTQVYQLEEGMRLGADDSECPEEIPDPQNEGQMLSIRYYLVLDLAYAGGSMPVRLANELRGDSTPVSFPNDLNPNVPGNASLTMERWKRVCQFPNTLAESCSNSQENSEQLNLQVNPAGSACEPVFDHYAFTIEDDDPNDFESVQVTSVLPMLPFLTEPQVQQYSFQASAKKLNGNTPSTFFQSISLSQPFAVFAKDPSSNVKAGLLGSRIEGYRSAMPFTYSCEPPNPWRDAVALCGGNNPSAHAYHRLPFAYNHTVNVGQSNFGGSSHYSDQIYAIDFNEPMNTPIHATRGGIVRRVVSNLDTNCAGSTEPVPGCPRFGNHVFIEHQDGTWGGYMHMKKDSATVWPGLEIKRGHVIGNVGNTGRSGGPHLHHHVVPGIGSDQGQIINANSVPILWEAYPEGGGNLLQCMVPAHSTNYQSSND